MVQLNRAKRYIFITIIIIIFTVISFVPLPWVNIAKYDTSITYDKNEWGVLTSETGEFELRYPEYQYRLVIRCNPHGNSHSFKAVYHTGSGKEIPLSCIEDINNKSEFIDRIPLENGDKNSTVEVEYKYIIGKTTPFTAFLQRRTTILKEAVIKIKGFIRDEGDKRNDQNSLPKQ